MSLVNHNHGIFCHPRIKLHFLQQDTIGHDFNFCGNIGLVFKTHLVADKPRIIRFELLCDKFRNTEGCNSPRLGHGNHTVLTISRLMQNHRNLSGFSTSGRRLYDDNLIIFKTFENLFFLFVNW